MVELFGRYAEVIITDKAGTAFIINNGYSITMSVKETGKATSGDITISNPPAAIAEAAINGSRVTLITGYENDFGTLFIGSIEDANTNRTPTGTELKIKAKAAAGGVSRKTISISAKAGTTAKALFSKITALTGVAITTGAGVKDESYPGGFAFIGRPLAAIEQIATRVGGVVKTKSNGTINIEKTGAAASGGTAVLLSKTTGLLGYPKKIIRKNSSDKPVTGWEITSVNSHRLTVGEVVQIKSDVVGLENQFYSIADALHNGNNQAGKWESKIECFTEVVQ